jgi:hypothetical protein
MKPSIWDQAVTDLERASARLMAAQPGNTPLIEDALARRAEAIERIQSIKSPPDAETLNRLEKACAIGGTAQQQLVVSREQLRDSIARLNQSSYLGKAFTAKSTTSAKVFDCEG